MSRGGRVMNRTGSSLIRVRVRIGVASHSLALPSLLLNAPGYLRTFRECLCGRPVTLRYQHCPMPTHNKTDNAAATTDICHGISGEDTTITGSTPPTTYSVRSDQN
ncbi:hypothetical protein Zmor_002208 [Zophobas morio]|uniref:Uncharacterized protein n=1 Tax=Zophobas morio TaxID=2755281 RepID=A0AA38J9A5_9CUCU|nr:hypothetical protein Zmor_002208 [Zophobas morio]